MEQVLALDRLLLCGTIRLDATTPVASGPDIHGDGFVAFRPKSLEAVETICTGDTPPPKKRRKVDSPARLVTQLELLHKHHLARATYRIEAPQTILLRLYLVPVDLPGFQRCLSQAARSAHQRAAAQCSRALSEVLSRTLDNDGSAVLSGEADHESLLSIWQRLPSPAETPLAGLDSDASELLSSALDTGPSGLITELYGYQKRTLWKMLARELVPQPMADATFAEHVALDDQRYFIDAQCEVRLHADVWTDARGGVLGETPGAGKTIECLALILATRGRPALVEPLPNEVAAPLVRTDLVDPQYVGRVQPDIDAPVDVEDFIEAPVPPPVAVPSLVSLLVDDMRRRPDFSVHDLEAHLPNSAALHAYKSVLPYYLEKPPPEAGSLRSRRALAAKDASHRIIVSSTTLCVVPNILVAQWVSQIEQHVEQGALKVLVLVGQDAIPTPEELAAYDLILMSLGRFQAQAKKLLDATCACQPPLPLEFAMRPPRCKCKIADIKQQLAPFLSIHFRRIVIDEGHVVGAEESLAVRLAARLRSSARWVVSGTPTRNLVSVDASGTSSAGLRGQATALDSDDLSRIGHIMGFLRCSPFANGVRSFDKYCRLPFLAGQAGAASRVSALLGRIIVKNVEEDIRKDAPLPPITERVQRLPFDAVNRTSYNVLLALFSLNSVLTEREDAQYFFHARNRKALQQILRNLERAQFFHASADLWQAVNTALFNYKDEVLGDKEEYVKKSARRTEADKALLQKSIACLRAAADDKTWCRVMIQASLQLRVQVNGAVADAWDWRSKMLASNESEEQRNTSFFAEKILESRRALKSLLEGGTWQDDDDLIEELVTKGHEASQAESHVTTASEEERHHMKTVGLLAKKPLKGTEEVVARPMPPSSKLHDACIYGSGSPKIDWIIAEVQSCPQDKFLVFTSDRNAAFFLSESLDIAGIRYLLLVAEGLTIAQREQYVQLFQESPDDRVLIADLAQASRGLTLTAANRVIFTSPIWMPDREAQAKKRAHRIGQIRPVTVDVLVMSDSFEERLIDRRNRLSGEDFRQIGELPHQDTELRTALENAAFVEHEAVDSMWRQPVALFPEHGLVPHYIESRARRSSASGHNSAVPSGLPPTELATAMDVDPPSTPALSASGWSSTDSSPQTPAAPSFATFVAAEQPVPSLAKSPARPQRGKRKKVSFA